MGAFGVALELKKRIALSIIKKQDYSLSVIVSNKVVYEQPFTCTGGKEKCDLKCRVNRIRIGDKVFPFGGVCSRYYNLRYDKQKDPETRDYITIRNNLMFQRKPVKSRKGNDSPVIGLNHSFITLRLYPMYHAFFTALGCKVVMPDTITENAPINLETSFCFPAHIAIDLFRSMLDNKEIDYFFIPHVKELYVPGGITRRDFCSTCSFSRGEAFYLRRICHEYQDKILTPSINFNGGWKNGLKAFLWTGRQLGFSGKEIKSAFTAGVKAQNDFEQTCTETGRNLLEDIRKHPGEIVIVLFGRPYNAYSAFANKGIPKKFTSRGYTVIPYEMIDYTNEPIDEEHTDFMTWEAGQRILRVARIVKRDSRLFGVFITNFLCGPDSFIVPYFRKIMGTKPSLTLELDEHTADAGINTRIEAFLDIIANYRKISPGIQPDSTNHFLPAKISFEHQGVVYIDSAGKRFKPTHPQVKMLIPHMATLGGMIFAIAVRRQGISAEALPPSDTETLHLGRGVTTGKECLPLILIIGSIVKYLKYRRKAGEKENLMLFVPKASGHCRFGQYHIYINQYIKENRIKDVALLDLGMEERFTGLSATFNFHAWRGVIISDVLEEIKYSLKVLAKDREQGMRIYNEEVKKILHALEFSSGRKIYRQLRRTAYRLKEIPLKVPYEDAAKIALTGEIFVRQDHFSNLHMADRLADAGFVVVTSPIAEILYYANFMINEKIKEPRYTLTGWLEFIISEKTQTFVEKKIKRILSHSGLFTPELVDVDDLISHSEYFFPRDCDGEHGLTVGLAVRDALTRYCAIVHVGPFGCMQSRFADATFIPEADVKRKRFIFRSLGKELVLPGFEDSDRIPFLSVESDGNPSPQMLEVRFESFCLEAERAANKLGKVVVKSI